MPFGAIEWQTSLRLECRNRVLKFIHWVEIFPAPAVAGQLTRMIEARIHNDGANQKKVRAKQVEMINTYATPSYALIDPATEEIIDSHDGPEFDSDTFAAWLKGAMKKWEAR